MLYVIIGGSGSGKSEYAEKLMVNISALETMQYVATMYPYEDEETRRKIEKHRRQRSGMGFYTIEQPLSIKKLQSIKKLENVLIECMSNLLANEMYMGDNPQIDESFLLEEIVNPIIELSGQCTNVVVVTNEVFNTADNYDEEMKKYISSLGFINRKLCSRADSVVEIFCGIPIVLKGDVPC